MITQKGKFCIYCGGNSWSVCTNSEGHHFVWAYRLKDGSRGSEFQAIEECITYWTEQKKIAEIKIAEYTKRLETAEK